MQGLSQLVHSNPLREVVLLPDPNESLGEILHGLVVEVIEGVHGIPQANSMQDESALTAGSATHGSPKAGPAVLSVPGSGASAPSPW